MSPDEIKQTGEIIFAGMTKSEFFCVSGISILVGMAIMGFIMWYINLVNKPMKNSQQEMKENLAEAMKDIKTMLGRIKTDEEIKQVAHASVLEHVIKCEGKAIMPQVLNALSRNTLAFERHSENTKELATAIHGLTYEVERKKA